jgi:hypothetical protein
MLQYSNRKNIEIPSNLIGCSSLDSSYMPNSIFSYQGSAIMNLKLRSDVNASKLLKSSAIIILSLHIILAAL